MGDINAYGKFFRKISKRSNEDKSQYGNVNSLSIAKNVTKLAPPKSKYVEHILVATHGGEAGVAEIFRALQNRLRDSTWTIVFKSLIVIHFMIREGELDVTLRYLSNSPQQKLAINSFTEGTYEGNGTVPADVCSDMS